MQKHYYKNHLFFCVNRREDGEQCCADYDAQMARDYCKRRVKELHLNGKGGVRVNQAGCLDRCSEGPVLVVYPAGIWYTFVDEEDLEEIVVEHLYRGRPVARLQI